MAIEEDFCDLIFELKLNLSHPNLLG